MDNATTLPTMTGILFLAEADAAASGALAALFAPEFPGGPLWRGPVVATTYEIVDGRTTTPSGHRYGWLRLRGRDLAFDFAPGGDPVGLGSVGLPLDVPSVAAHVAWMCARAIDPRATFGWADRGPSGWVLHWTLPEGAAKTKIWQSGGYSWGSGPRISDDVASPQEFLVELFLALAKTGRITSQDRAR